MYVLISYDIVNDRVRTKVMKFLKDYGTRVQRSVFECHLDDGKFTEVKEALGKLINKKEDRIRFYAICQACMERIEVYGWGTVNEEEDFAIV